MKKKVDLKTLSVEPPKDLDKNEIKAETQKLVAELSELQNLMFANAKRSLLIVLQGMDASGKDGAVKKIFSAVNPNGVKVQSFRKPTTEELAHDFLWRLHKYCPEKGMIQIFNRSHYEDVLVTRVLGIIDDKTAEKRFELINDFEKLLEYHGTRVLKFYLHIDEDIQRQKFHERLEDPTKNWKYNPEDLKAAQDWPAYRKYYSEVFEKCGPDNPWTIIPASKNWYKEFLFAKTIVEELRSWKMEYPRMSNEEIEKQHNIAGITEEDETEFQKEISKDDKNDKKVKKDKKKKKN